LKSGEQTESKITNSNSGAAAIISNKNNETPSPAPTFVPTEANDDWGKAKKLFQHGEKCFVYGEYECAIAAYQDAANYSIKYKGKSINGAPANPKIAEIFNQMGHAYLMLRQYEQAVEVCQKALNIESNDSDKLYRLGLSYNKMNRPKDTIAAFEKAINAGEEAAHSHRLLGTALYRMGKIRDSNKHSEIQHTLEINLDDAYYKLGLAYNKIGNVNLAWEQVRALNTRNLLLTEKLRLNIKGTKPTKNSPKLIYPH
jgi:tetratricopeptide (TPR) repeat protein